MTDKNAYLTIDVGGTYLKSAVISEEGYLYEESKFNVPTYSDRPRRFMLRSVEECISHSLSFAMRKGVKINGIGIAIPGPFDYHKGIFLMEHKFKDLYGLNLKGLIHQMEPASREIPICFVHDANAVLMGEQWKGKAAGYDNSAVITLGTGIGLAHTQGRVVQCSPLGSPSASIYNLPYRDGILEDYVSQRGALRVYRELNGGSAPEGITVLDISRQADKGDARSILTFRTMGSILAETTAGILKQKNIQCLLLGGQISNAFPHIEEPLKEGLSAIKTLKLISTVDSIDHAAFYGVVSEMI